MIRGLFGRLLLVMCGVATASTVLVLILQERSLSKDLEQAAERRLDAAARAADRLVAGRLETMAERYHAVSGTPQFRAVLEVNDGPTLTHYSTSLMERHKAVRIAFVDDTGRLAGGAGDAGLDAAALGANGTALVAFEGAAYAAVGQDVAGSGRLVAVEPIGKEDLDGWSELCGARVSFAGVGAEPDAELERVVREFDGLELRVSSTLEAERAAMANARRSLLFAGGLGLGLAFLVSLAVTRGLVRPIQRLQAAARQIGAGDLTVRVDTSRSDEIGDVARSFEEMIEGLRRTIRSVVEAADRVEGTAGEIGQGTRRLLSVVETQQRDNEKTAASLGGIQERVRSIATAASESSGRLDASVDGSTASFRELAASGETLEQTATSLGAYSADITSSIQQVATGAQQVAADTEALLPAVDAAMGRVDELARVARTVNSHANETTRLSAKVVESAEEGRQIVRNAVEGMQVTRDTVRDSQQVVEALRHRVEKIGDILGVIDDVTDETGLLALNGSIIAAQAGEQGRAFQVVAEQLRALANRVRQSTKEIEGVVHAVQAETSNAVESIAHGSARAEAGAALIQEAEAALDAITGAARESRERMAESVSATTEQTRTAIAVVEDMQEVRAGVDRIRTVTREQAEAAGVVERSAGELLAVAKDVQTTVKQQTHGAAQIGLGVEAVQLTVREMTSGLEEQAAASDQVIGVVRAAARYSEAQHASAREIEHASRELERQAEALREAMRHFRIED